MSDTATSGSGPAAEMGFMWKLFYALACMAGLSLAISVGGRFLGHSISLGGHSESTALREIVIGNNVLSVPENAIRFERQRHDGEQNRLDLYFKWPEMSGYSDAYREAFNFVAKDASIVFVSFEEQIMSRDMSGRFEPIYRPLLETPASPGPAGLSVYRFTEKSGYVGETLVTGASAAGELFVARCLEQADLLTACERDVIIGDRLSLNYRFSRDRLPEWRAIDSAILVLANKILKTGR